MSFKSKKIILNRYSDWKVNGTLNHILCDNDELVSNQENGENGTFFSSSFDSMEEGMRWHRLRVKYYLPQNSLIRTRIYVSNSKYVRLLNPETGKDMDVLLDDYLNNQEIDDHKKIEVLNYIGAKTYENPYDVLLYDFVGRYIWIALELINYSKEPIRISSAKLEFGSDNFISYLPDIYQRSDESTFLARYIGIYQSLYTDLDEDIDNMPSNFDVDLVGREFLDWLTSWFSIKDSFIWGEKKLRQILKSSVWLYKIKGTKQSISEVVKLYTGAHPIILEHFDVTENEYYAKNKEHVDNLYGKSTYTFTVILSPEYVPTSEKYVELLRIINTFKPIDAICNLVVLNNNMYLDHHCYLEMNSYIATNKEVVVESETCMPNLVFLTN